MSLSRIAYLDGLRGVAILIVVFYHGYSRWGSIETFEQNATVQEVFAHGWLGVQLFFAISGYVIYMTLLRSQNIFMFAVNRYLRLAPAMLVASLLIYLSSFWIVERPLGAAHPQDLLPSVTFIDPILLSKLTGLDVKSLDDAFWSLYIEVWFYGVAALLFFVCKDKALNGISFLYFAYLLTEALHRYGVDSTSLAIARSVLDHAGAMYYAWFLVGIFSCKYAEGHRNASLIIGGLFALLGSAQIVLDRDVTVSLIVLTLSISVSFMAPLFSNMVKTILESKALVFFGFISYPLYLLHQNVVTGLAIKLHNAGVNLPSVLYPIPCILLVIIISYGLAKVEPYIKSNIQKALPLKLFGMAIHRV
jgi:peptidoglycan/LPS O-acetylase OafA/YrhL